jgi:hypothetical protein
MRNPDEAEGAQTVRQAVLMMAGFQVRFFCQSKRALTTLLHESTPPT